MSKNSRVISELKQARFANDEKIAELKLNLQTAKDHRTEMCKEMISIKEVKLNAKEFYDSREKVKA